LVNESLHDHNQTNNTCSSLQQYNKLLKWSLESFQDVVKAHLALERGEAELGDALFYADEDTQNKVLVEVASWGIGCNKSGAEFPAGLYSRISSQWDWIKSMICNGHSNPKPRLFWKFTHSV